MLVKSILKIKGASVVKVGPDQTVAAVIHVLREKRIGAVLVCGQGDSRGDSQGDDSGHDVILGVFSERDLVRALADVGPAVLDQPIRTLMTRDVIYCSLEDSIDTVMGLMTDRRIRHLPVLDAGHLAGYSAGHLVGIISIGDVVKHRIAETEMEAEALKSYIATG